MEAVVTCASADDYCGSRTCFTGFGISSFETCCDIRKTAQGDHRCFQDATPWAGTPQCFSGGEHAYNRCCDTSVSATGGDSCWTDEITFETCCPDPRPTSCFYCCFQQEDSPAPLALEAFTGEVACADDANSDTSAMPGTRQPRHAPSSALSRWEYTADEISTVVEACPVTCNTGPCAWFTAELSFDACCSVAADQRDPACFNYGASSFGECCLVLPPAQLCTDSSFSGGSCTAGDDGRLTVFNAGGSCMGASCSQQECCIELPAPAPVPVLEPEPAQACTDSMFSSDVGCGTGDNSTLSVFTRGICSSTSCVQAECCVAAQVCADSAFVDDRQQLCGRSRPWSCSVQCRWHLQQHFVPAGRVLHRSNLRYYLCGERADRLQGLREWQRPDRHLAPRHRPLRRQLRQGVLRPGWLELQRFDRRLHNHVRQVGPGRRSRG